MFNQLNSTEDSSVNFVQQYDVGLLLKTRTILLKT